MHGTSRMRKIEILFGRLIPRIGAADSETGPTSESNWLRVVLTPGEPVGCIVQEDRIAGPADWPSRRRTYCSLYRSTTPWFGQYFTFSG